MPSRNPDGSRLSGAGQRRRAAANRGDEGEDNPFADWPPPPCAAGPAAVEGWAAQMGARALEAAQLGDDPARVRWVSKTVRRLGQMKDKARHSWKACRAVKEYRQQEVDLLSDQQPAQSYAVVAWAYYRLAHALHDAATRPTWDVEVEASATLIVEAAASLGYVPQVQAMRELMAELAPRAGARPR